MGLSRLVRWGAQRLKPTSGRVHQVISAAEGVMDTPISDCAHSHTPRDISKRVREHRRARHEDCSCGKMHTAIKRGYDLFMGTKERPMELSRKRYMLQYLTRADVESLEGFLGVFNDGLKTRGADSAIIAVGSSTFPMSYWLTQESMEEDEGIPRLRYGDIDLYVAPQEQCLVKELSDLSAEILKERGYEFERRSLTRTGMSGRFLHINYGVHSISSELPNGTGIDLIFGEEGPCVTAERKVREERAENRPFSLLYYPGQ